MKRRTLLAAALAAPPAVVASTLVREEPQAFYGTTDAFGDYTGDVEGEVQVYVADSLDDVIYNVSPDEAPLMVRVKAQELRRDMERTMLFGAPR